MPIYFTRGASSVQMKEPTWPEGEELYPRQTVGFSDGGRIQVSVDGDPDVVITLNFVRVPASQYDALKAFFQNQTSWSAYTFQYQDWNGYTYNNIRYMDGIHTFKRNRGGRYNGTLTMRTDMGS